jgi:GNAT superfamily N-acetyltransferase
VELVPASRFSAAELAALFTAVYEGYQFPMRLDEAGFSYFTRAFSYDLDRSRVALRGGEPIGLAMLAIRGRRGWVGGVGDVPSVRRRGVGLALMEAVLGEAWAAGLATVQLEVLEPNDGAFRLYDRLGFEPTRMLEVWRLDAEPPASVATPGDADEAAKWIRARRSRPEPWQREDESVAGNDHLEAFAVGERGRAIVRAVDGSVVVLQLVAEDVEAATELLAAARLRGDVLSFTNVLEGDPASVALAQLGGQLAVRQHEMLLRRE